MKRSLIALALAALLPISAQASEKLSYNYVELGYASSSFVDETFSGFSLKGSVEFGENFYGDLSYRNVDNNDFDISLDEAVLNLGYHVGISENADFLAELGYVRVGADIGGFDDNSDGYRGAVGIRGMMAPSFEGTFKANYTKLNDFDSDGEFGATVSGMYHINETWGVLASYDFATIADESINTWGLGVRASF